ncbi:uncharacterized protein KZ484_007512 [Pholidichthys leucotaenia]
MTFTSANVGAADFPPNPPISEEPRVAVDTDGDKTASDTAGVIQNQENRNIVLLFSVFLLQVKADANEAGLQTTSTDKDSISDEAPTESMNAVIPDQPDEPQYYGGGQAETSSSSSEMPDSPDAIQGISPEPVVAAVNNVEEDDEDESTDSEEGGKKKTGSGSVKPQGSTHIKQSPALPPQPIIPQPKTLKSRSSKRRSRTSRRQI